MTENLQPVIVQFEKYLAAKHNEKPWLINYAGGEAQHRLHQLDWLCRRIGKLEAKAVELIHEITSGDGPSDGYVKDNPAMLESRANSFEMETMVEAFYYFAFRLRQVIRQLPELSDFECEGVRNVRNKLLEHPEGRDSGVIHGAFGYGDTETGPVLKMLRFPLKNTLWQDAGLWVNTKELAQNLTKKLTRLSGNPESKIGPHTEKTIPGNVRNRGVYRMAQRRDEIEAFVRRLVAEVEAAEAAGLTAPQAIADHFNAKGLTTRKGRRWTGATVAKFLSSPGAKRTRSGA